VSGSAEIDLIISQQTTSASTTQPSGEAPFAISLRPDELTVRRGELAQFSLMITTTGAFTGRINLEAQGIPPGSTYIFAIEGLSVYLRIQTSQLTPEGSYEVIVIGRGDGYEARDSATLVVTSGTQASSPTTSPQVTSQQTTSPQAAASFSLSLSGDSVEVTRGGNARISASITGSGGFSSPVTLSVSGLPDGITISSDVNNLPPPFTANLLISASAGAPLGNHTISVVATGGGMTRTATLRVTVRQAAASQPSVQPRISVSLSQNSLTLRPGDRASIAVSVTSDVPVNLSLSGAPADMSYRFDPDRLGGSGISSLLLSPGSTTGSFTLIVRASGGGAEGSATLILLIQPPESPGETQTGTMPTASLLELLIGVLVVVILLGVLALLLVRRRALSHPAPPSPPNP